jgi:hypothetical protein
MIWMGVSLSCLWQRKFSLDGALPYCTTDTDVNKPAVPIVFVAPPDGCSIQILNQVITAQGVSLCNGWCGESPWMPVSLQQTP